MKKNEMNYPIPLTKSNAKWIKDLKTPNCKTNKRKHKGKAP